MADVGRDLASIIEGTPVKDAMGSLVTAPKSVGEAMRTLIHRAGFSEAQAARYSQVSPSSLSQYLRDRRKPSFTVVARVVDALGQRFDWDDRQKARALLELHSLAVGKTR